jgi:hypothetical protein
MGYSGTSSGDRLALGTGGDCGTALGNVTLDYRENLASVAFSFSPTVIVAAAGLYLSCFQPNGAELPETFNIYEDFGACGVTDEFILVTKEIATDCDNGAW